MLTEKELTGKGFHNRNFITGRLYLWLQNQMKLNEAGFAIPEWLTFLQIKQNGYVLKKWSEGLEVIYAEPIAREDVDSNGKVSVKSIPYLKKHIVFNVDQVDKVSNPKPQMWNTTYMGNQQNNYTDNMITQKQRLYLIKLIETKYEDERVKSWLLNRINELSRSDAKQAIKRMLAESN